MIGTFRSVWGEIKPWRLGSGAAWDWTPPNTYRVRLRTRVRRFFRDARRGRPMICHECGKPMLAGQWIQRVRVPALPWTMWRHRSFPCGPGRDDHA